MTPTETSTGTGTGTVINVNRNTTNMVVVVEGATCMTSYRQLSATSTIITASTASKTVAQGPTHDCSLSPVPEQWGSMPMDIHCDIYGDGDDSRSNGNIKMMRKKNIKGDKNHHHSISSAHVTVAAAAATSTTTAVITGTFDDDNNDFCTGKKDSGETGGSCDDLSMRDVSAARKTCMPGSSRPL